MKGGILSFHWINDIQYLPLYVLYNNNTEVALGKRDLHECQRWYDETHDKRKHPMGLQLIVTSQCYITHHRNTTRTE